MILAREFRLLCTKVGLRDLSLAEVFLSDLGLSLGLLALTLSKPPSRHSNDREYQRGRQPGQRAPRDTPRLFSLPVRRRRRLALRSLASRTIRLSLLHQPLALGELTTLFVLLFGLPVLAGRDELEMEGSRSVASRGRRAVQLLASAMSLPVSSWLFCRPPASHSIARCK
jgi:hypothetical protein